jgi:flavin-binding protein dodecin
MSMVKVIELSSESPNNWENATRRAVECASRTLRNIALFRSKSLGRWWIETMLRSSEST